MITQKQWDDVIALISNGLTNDDACAYAAISRSTFYERMKDNADFSDAVKKAAVHFKTVHLQNIQTASKKQWQASAWLLERKFKGEFSIRQEMTGADGAPLVNKPVIDWVKTDEA